METASSRGVMVYRGKKKNWTLQGSLIESANFFIITQLTLHAHGRGAEPPLLFYAPAASLHTPCSIPHQEGKGQGFGWHRLGLFRQQDGSDFLFPLWEAERQWKQNHIHYANRFSTSTFFPSIAGQIWASSSWQASLSDKAKENEFLKVISDQFIKEAPWAMLLLSRCPRSSTGSQNTRHLYWFCGHCTQQQSQPDRPRNLGSLWHFLTSHGVAVPQPY